MSLQQRPLIVTANGHTGTLTYERFDIGGAGRWVLRIGQEVVGQTTDFLADNVDGATRWATRGLHELATPVRPHIRREVPPWREGVLTECGRQLADVAAAISRAEALTILRRDGKTRAAYALCITCLDSTLRWKGWDESPRDALARDFYNGRRGEGLDAELLALAALVRAHRDEFEALLHPADHGAVDLAEERLRRQRSERTGPRRI